MPCRQGRLRPCRSYHAKTSARFAVILLSAKGSTLGSFVFMVFGMKRSLPDLAEAIEILRQRRTKKAPSVGPTVARPVTPILKGLELKFAHLETPLAQLSRRWNDIVGETIARICEPSKIVKSRLQNVLEIRVAGAYAALLQHQQATLLDRINLFLGQSEISRLKFIQGPLQHKDSVPAKPLKVPLNAAEELALLHTLDTVDDKALKDSLLKLGRAVLQKEKMSLK